MTSREVENDEEGQASEMKTVPPPAGESDAYNAPTRVADLDANTYAKLLEHYAGPQVDAVDPAGASALSPEDIPIPMTVTETESARSSFASAPLPVFPDYVESLPGAALIPASERSITYEQAPPSSVAPFASPPRSRVWMLVVWVITVSVVVMVAALVAIWLTP